MCTGRRRRARLRWPWAPACARSRGGWCRRGPLGDADAWDRRAIEATPASRGFLGAVVSHQRRAARSKSPRSHRRDAKQRPGPSPRQPAHPRATAPSATRNSCPARQQATTSAKHHGQKKRQEGQEAAHGGRARRGRPRRRGGGESEGRRGGRGHRVQGARRAAQGVDQGQGGGPRAARDGRGCRRDQLEEEARRPWMRKSL